MADTSRSVRINIGTVGNPKGAKTVAKALEEVADLQEKIANAPAAPEGANGPAEIEKMTEALKQEMFSAEDAAKSFAELAKKQADADLAAVKATRSAKEQAAALKEIQFTSKAIIALQLAGALSDSVKEIAEMTRESGGGKLGEALSKAQPAINAASTGVSSITAGLGTAAVTGSPIIGLIAGIGIQVKDVVKAVIDMNKQFSATANAEAFAVEQAEQLRLAQLGIGKAVKAANLKDEYGDMADEAGRLLTNLQNINLLEEARDRAKASIRKTSGENAVRNGADPVAVASDNTVAGLSDATAALDRQVAEATAKIQGLNVEAEKLFDAAATAKASGQATEAEIDDAYRAYLKAEGAVSDAKDQAANIAAAAELTKQGLAADAASELSQLGDTVGKTVTDSANSAIKMLEDKAKATGEELSGEATRVLNLLKELVTDKIPDQKQADELKNLLSLLRQAQDAKDVAIYSGITALMDSAAAQQRKYEALQRKIDDLSRQMGGVDQKINGVIR